MEFNDHVLEDKSDFPIGTFTLLRGNVIYQAPSNICILIISVNSMSCYNKEIEWNYAYFRKIRLCFYRKIKDVKITFRDPMSGNNQDLE